jgi:hypothetical protein
MKFNAKQNEKLSTKQPGGIALGAASSSISASQKRAGPRDLAFHFLQYALAERIYESDVGLLTSQKRKLT